MISRSAGIVLMMLVGLLLALPASAAPAGAVSGTIEFRDEKGGDAITHVSLNGPAAETDGFWFQVSDPDLNVVKKYEGLTAHVITTLGPVTAPSGVFWYDVVDKNGDGWVDSRDITGAVIANPGETNASLTIGGVNLTSDPGPNCTVNFDKTNSTLSVNDCASFDHDNDGDTANVTMNALEFWAERTQVIGTRGAAAQKATYEYNDSLSSAMRLNAGEVDNGVSSLMLLPASDNVTDDSVIPNFTLLGDDPGWLEVMQTNMPDIDLKEQIDGSDAGDAAAATRKADVERLVEQNVRAWNTGRMPWYSEVNKKDYLEPDLIVEADFTVGRAAHGNIAAVPAALSINVKGAPPTDFATEPYLLVARASRGGLLFQDTTVSVEFGYMGSPGVAYKDGLLGNEKELGRVTVSSNGHSIGVMLQETGAATGVFGTTIKICDAKESDCKASQANETDVNNVILSPTPTTRQITLPVDAEGDTITISYKDDEPGGTRTASVVVDPSGPSFSGFAPAHRYATRDDEPTVSFEVRDGAAGISGSDDDVASVYVVAGVYDLKGAESKDSVVYERNEVKLTSVTDGYAASVAIEEGTDDADELDSGLLENDKEYEIRWWAVAADKAGNVGVSDRDGATKCLNVNSAANSALLEFGSERTQAQSDAIIRALEGTYKKQVGKSGDADYEEGEGCDPHVVRVDTRAPTLVSAVTGSWLDGDVEKSGTDAKRTSLVAVFHEALDCDTVSADDFTVGGSAPKGVTCKEKKVYLDVSELAADAKPKVVVADGSVSDRAGNAIGGTDASRTVTAADGIAAKLTITVTGTGEGTRPVTNKTVTIHISSDERLSGRPKVSIQKVWDNYSLSDDVSGDEEGQPASPTGAANEWSLKRDFIHGTGTNPNGLYNVSVMAQDRGSSLKAVTGLTEFDKDSLKDKKAILFEVDKGVQPPVFHPTEGSKTDTENLFVTANFKLEGTEYGLSLENLCRRSSDDLTLPNDKGVCPDGYDKYTPQHATSSPSRVVTNFDSHKTLTLASATFDGEDVTEEVESRDNVTFLYRPVGAAVGEHTLELKVKDNAGNEGTFTLKFELTERVKWKLPIHPGANLISLPAEPVDGSIDAVFGGEPDVTSVVTYDAASGLWMTAARGADGAFAGDLTSIGAKHGYWVVSDGGLDVPVTLMRSGGITISPVAIEVAPGWNLVPVADVRQRAAGTGIDTDKYFANIDADVAYGYDALTGSMARLSLATAAEGQAQDQVKVGNGYWVYANEAGVIVP